MGLIDERVMDGLTVLAIDWARTQEKFILTHGSALTAGAMDDARQLGVREPERVRVLVVDKIPLPSTPELAEASRRANIITDASRGVAIGHGVMIRADRWGDRELMAHQLVHVAQCERSGGLEAFVMEYVLDRRTCNDFTVGSLEEEARESAHRLCGS